MFAPEVAGKLRYYVYRLIDPRNGETFYVGKGNGNRVFEHAAGEQAEDSDVEKIERIRRIKIARLDVGHIIHRHGMDEKTAFEVEAALIDAYPGLANIAGGHGSSEFGSMHHKEVVERYVAKEMEFHHKIILISVNNSATERSLYEATRFSWRLDRRRASKADYVVATVRGLGVGVFEAEEWLPATAENFPGLGPVDGRHGFVGKEAPLKIRKMYVGRRTPEKFRKKGASNPIKYAF